MNVVYTAKAKKKQLLAQVNLIRMADWNLASPLVHDGVFEQPGKDFRPGYLEAVWEQQEVKYYR